MYGFAAGACCSTEYVEWIFQFIGSEVYNIVDKTFPLPLLLKEGYVWFRGLSLLLH